MLFCFYKKLKSYIVKKSIQDRTWLKLELTGNWVNLLGGFLFKV